MNDAFAETARQRTLRATLPRAVRSSAIAGLMLLVVFWCTTGSLIDAVALTVVMTGLGWGLLQALHACGLDWGHPAMLRARSRVWRDAIATLRAALRHVDQVFVAGPGGRVYAPSSIEIVVAPGILRDLLERMDQEVLTEFVTRGYDAAVQEYGAELRGNTQVTVVGSPAVPRGGYVVRRAAAGRRPAARHSVTNHDGQTLHIDLGHEPAVTPSAKPAVELDIDRRCDPRIVASKPTLAAPDLASATLTEQMVAVELGLETAGRSSRTLISPAIAGRDPRCDLPLAVDATTISRRHAEFTYRDGEWWVQNLGRNGLQLNPGLSR